MPDDFDFSALAGALDNIPAPPPDGEGTVEALLHYFGDYLLEEEIARGGMGIVYRARQLSLDRVVAVKVLREGVYAGGTAVERFKLEAAAAARLRHPNIVGIYEIGECEGRYFFSMEYVAGPTLAQLTAEGPPGVRKAAELLLGIAQAIQHAHTHGVMHRDLKPSNILLHSDGVPMVTDFGLARCGTEPGNLTLSGQVLGTPAYMAPEQAESRRDGPDPRTDVYGLGALFYHLLGGRPPFIGESHLSVLKQVAADEPVSLRLLNPSVPRDLETICAKAMAKDAARRYQTAAALSDDVGRYLDGKPVIARPLGPAGRGWRWARRHRAVAASLALTLAALAGLAGVMFFSNRRLAAQAGLLREQAYAAEVAQASHEVAAYHPGRARELLARQRPAAGATDLRGLEWRFLSGAVRGQEHAVIGREPSRLRALAVSRDGLRAVGVTQAGHVTLWDLPGRRALASAQHGVMTSSVVFSPDEKEILTGGDDGFIRRWRADGLTEIPGAWEQPGHILKLSFSPDGSRLLCALRDGLTVRNLTDPPGGLVRREFTAWFDASFSPDGKRLVIPSVSGPVAVRDVESGAETSLLRLDADQAGSSAFSPQGNLVALGYAGGMVRVWDFSGNKLAATLPAHGGVCYAEAFSPDGRWLATGGNDGLLKVWSTETWTLVSVQRGHMDGVSSVAWLDAGRLLTGGRDGLVAQWDRIPADASGWTPMAAPLGAAPFTRNGGVWLFNSQTGEATDTATRETRVAWSAAQRASGSWQEVSPTPGGDCLVVLPDNVRELRTWDGITILGRFPGREEPWGGAVVSRDGRQVHTTILRGIVRQMVVGRLGEAQWDFVSNGPETQLIPYGFSPDGSWLSLVTTRGSLALYHTVARRVTVRRDVAHSGLPLGVSFSPDGTECASCGGDGLVKLWESATLEPRRILRGAPAFTCLEYAPDGRHLAAGTPDGAVLLWDLRTAREATVLRLPGPYYVLSLRWTDDGQNLVATARQGFMRWEARDGWE